MYSYGDNVDGDYVERLKGMKWENGLETVELAFSMKIFM